MAAAAAADIDDDIDNAQVCSNQQEEKYPPHPVKSLSLDNPDASINNDNNDNKGRRSVTSESAAPPIPYPILIKIGVRWGRVQVELNFG